MPHTMPVTLTVGASTAQIGQITAESYTWRETLAELLRNIADEIDRPPIQKLAVYQPLASGTCEHCGQPVLYNLAVGYADHTVPQADCSRPSPAVPGSTEETGR